MEQNEETIIYKRADFGKRFGAVLIDFAILYALGYLFGLILGKPTPPAPEDLIGLPPGEMMLLSMEPSLISFYVGLAYALMEIFVQKSPGKMILGLIIGNQIGEKPPMSALIIRYLFKQASNILFLAAVLMHTSMLIWIGLFIGLIYLGGCLMATSEKRLALHDLMAKTAVYNEKMLLEA